MAVKPDLNEQRLKDHLLPCNLWRELSQVVIVGSPGPEHGLVCQLQRSRRYHCPCQRSQSAGLLAGLPLCLPSHCGLLLVQCPAAEKTVSNKAMCTFEPVDRHPTVTTCWSKRHLAGSTEQSRTAAYACSLLFAFHTVMSKGTEISQGAHKYKQPNTSSMTGHDGNTNLSTAKFVRVQLS